MSDRVGNQNVGFLMMRLISHFQQESVFQQQSPTKRRESTPLLDKIKSDVNLIKQKLGNDKKGEKPKEVKEELPIMKYITSQVI